MAPPGALGAAVSFLVRIIQAVSLKSLSELGVGREISCKIGDPCRSRPGRAKPVVRHGLWYVCRKVASGGKMR